MPDNESEEPTIRDKRRIDPETGEAREPVADAAGSRAGQGASDGSAGDAQPNEAPELSAEDQALLDSEASALEAERDDTSELSPEGEELLRLKAEYVNYRSRVERERAGDRDATIAGVVKSLLPALDDLNLAEKHGDLSDGPLAIVAQKLRAGFAALGLETVGEVGELFSTDKHEAIAQLPNPEAQEMTVADVVQVGYRLGDRLLRPAKVAVFVPAGE